MKFLFALAAVILSCTPAYAACENNYQADVYGRPELVINNDIWNPVGTGTQCITSPPYGSVMSVTWSWSDTGTYDPHSYPSIIFGKNPWRENTRQDILPAPVGDFTAITATFRARTKATGIYNNAFDMWFTNGEPVVANIRTEIMVWTFYRERTTGGSPWPIVTVDKKKYRLITLQQKGRNLLAYHALAQSQAGTLKLMPFVLDAKKRGVVSDTDTLASVEFGAEIIAGKGTTDVLDYNLDFVTKQ